jgi:hypothetical protein
MAAKKSSAINTWRLKNKGEDLFCIGCLLKVWAALLRNIQNNVTIVISFNNYIRCEAATTATKYTL